MSGGLFGYQNDSLKSEIFGWCSGDDVPNVFEDREVSELIYDVFSLIHDFDWYQSADTSKETWLKQKKAFKAKWLGNNRGHRIKRIIDETINKAKVELYETFDMRGDGA